MKIPGLQAVARVRFAIMILLCGPVAFAAQGPTEAQQLQSQGDWKGAEQIWRKLIEQNRGDYRLWASLGVTLSQQVRYADATDAYRKALSLNPKDPQTELNLGIALFKWGHFAQAIPPLRSAVASGGSSPQTDILLGMALYGAGEYHDASAYLAKACERDTNNPELESTLAQSYLYSGQYEAAMKASKMLLLTNPDAPSVHMMLGEAYDATNQSEQAIEEFRRATVGPYVPNAHFGLGYLLWKAHRYDEAASEFQRELDNDAQNSQSLAYLGDIAVRRGDKSKAEQLLRRSIALRGDNRLAYVDLGAIEADNREFAPAEEHLKHAIRLDPKEANAHYRLARVYSSTNRPREAERELALVKQLHENTREDLLLKVSGTPKNGSPHR